jgi:hypothetical protein
VYVCGGGEGEGGGGGMSGGGRDAVVADVGSSTKKDSYAQVLCTVGTYIKR